VEEPFYAQSLASDNLCKLTQAIQTWGKWRGLKVHSYYPPAVKAFFCRDQKTKESLAEAMIERYSFLRRYLRFQPWHRRYWFHVFDAIGLGLMCQGKLVVSSLPESQGPGARKRAITGASRRLSLANCYAGPILPVMALRK